jgi:hypothetical protein
LYKQIEFFSSNTTKHVATYKRRCNLVAKCTNQHERFSQPNILFAGTERYKERKTSAENKFVTIVVVFCIFSYNTLKSLPPTISLTSIS